MLPGLLRAAGCFLCLHVALAGPAADDTCVMQTRRGEPSRPVQVTSIKAESLDRLVEKNYVNMSGATRRADQGAISRHVQHFEAWVDRQPAEIQALIKAVFISWAIAMLLGLVGMCLGVVTWYPPSKYVSWKAIAESEASILTAPITVLAKVPIAIMNLGPETRRLMLGIIFLFAVAFFIMWKSKVIQPVMKDLAAYVYVFALVGSIGVVVLIDLLKRASSTLTGPLSALHRMQQSVHRVEEKLGLVSTQEDTRAFG
mmetsp:Transcript_1776/g.3191  ORF Transcript_1776/g.3191 Transcript_1776/m.3191 type:complete len:257 (+) Transcript_1776:96-866(+)